MKLEKLLFVFALPLLVSCQPSHPSTSTSSEKESSSISSSEESTSSSSSVSYDDKETSFQVVSPQGAPAAALARYANDDSVVFGGAQDVKAAFTSANSDFIIFDSVNGMKLSKDNYRLVRMVTFGNLYLVSTGNDEDGVPSEDDFIFSYGKDLVPDLAFRAVSELTIDAYGAQVSDTGPVLKSGIYQGTKVDYVVSSYPVIANMMADTTKLTDLSITMNVAEEFGKKYGTDGFPQAGLFIKKSLQDDSSKRVEIEHFLTVFDADVRDLIAGGGHAVSFLNDYGDNTKQASRFGFNSTTLEKSQENNGLAFLAREDNPSLDEYSVFEKPLGITLPEGILSNYYPA